MKIFPEIAPPHHLGTIEEKTTSNGSFCCLMVAYQFNIINHKKAMVVWLAGYTEHNQPLNVFVIYKIEKFHQVATLAAGSKQQQNEKWVVDGTTKTMKVLISFFFFKSLFEMGARKH